MLKYTKVSPDVAKNFQLNAGILVDEFTPSSGAIGSILGSTSGGFKFDATATYNDLADGVDNMPANTKEAKQVDHWEAKGSGSFVSVTAELGKDLVGAGDNTEGHIVPRDHLEKSDFKDVWFVGDYSDVNTGANAGYIAIHMMDVLNTSGFSFQSNDGGKGAFAFEYLAHYTLADLDRVPFEIYIKQGA